MTLSFLFLQLEHIMDADRWLGVGGKLAFLLMTHQSDSMHHPAGQGSAEQASQVATKQAGCVQPSLNAHNSPLKKKTGQILSKFEKSKAEEMKIMCRHA